MVKFPLKGAHFPCLGWGCAETAPASAVAVASAERSIAGNWVNAEIPQADVGAMGPKAPPGSAPSYLQLLTPPSTGRNLLT